MDSTKANLHDQTPPEVEHGPYNCGYCRRQAYQFVAENPPPEPVMSWYVVVPASPHGGQTATFGPMPESEARSKFSTLTEALAPECSPKLLRVIEDAEEPQAARSDSGGPGIGAALAVRGE